MFAPPPKKVAKGTVRVPNVRVPPSAARAAAKTARGFAPPPGNSDDAYPVVGADGGPLPACWLCGAGCARFGWYMMPRDLTTPSGAALNYFTLCSGCTPLAAETRLSVAEIVDASRRSARGLASAAGRPPVSHSEGFVAFLVRYKALLERVAAEDRQGKGGASTRDHSCHQLSSLRHMLASVDSALSTAGLTPREQALLKLELSNLQEQAQIHNPSAVSPPAPAAAPAVAPAAAAAAASSTQAAAPPAVHAKRLQSPRSGGGGPAVISGSTGTERRRRSSSTGSASAGTRHAAGGGGAATAAAPAARAASGSAGQSSGGGASPPQSNLEVVEAPRADIGAPRLGLGGGGVGGGGGGGHARIDGNVSRLLQEEIMRLQESNMQSLAKLQALAHQHRELAAAHEVKCEEGKVLQVSLHESREREAFLEEKCRRLMGDVSGLKGRADAEHAGSEAVVAELRKRLLDAEAELRRKPEEVTRAQQARAAAAEEARELRRANAQIGERLLRVEEQLFQEQRENRRVNDGHVTARATVHRSPSAGRVASLSPANAPAAHAVPPLSQLMSTELQLLQEGWDGQDYTATSSPPQPVYPEQEASASPVRKEAPSPPRPDHQSYRSGQSGYSPHTTKGRQVVWADPQGHTVSFEIDPNTEREAF
eukprot:Rhum_TRINITY_DN9235_c0_g2::Rhum_TRINITY_DN9235_c0_g2_i1::g.32449::m.32449